MPSKHLGRNILEAVGPLILNGSHGRSKSVCRDAAGLTNVVRGQADRQLGVRGDFIPAVSSCVHASFIKKAWGDGAVPDDRECIVNLCVVQKVVGAFAAVKVSPG